ncbi:recombinase family protein (plasmid) [Escherichia coli]|uniref:recombinase family protein n=1 Tax=Klebsiella pneumoniae TaxID=573 RepID=UPI00247D6A71|nr:recombinase family protein [Klebsiella pneumoniae]MDH6728916.1 recombinase family protein [Escherichia coli]MDW1230742.1 recombinase family protein [Klebsiella pneumoniae]WHJ36398.1 recombinase family protein [Escherichia coli]
MQYAYIRVSSADQNTARQEEALSKAGFQPDKICVEHASAKDTNRPGLQELLGQLRPGDTLLVHSIDRLCRNMSDMCAVTTRLRDQGVTLIFLKGVSLDIENYCTLRLFFDLSTLAGLSRRNLPEAGIRLLFHI